ncbi:MAG: helix-turn-helix transcriptional regulator [Bacteroidales bacterium]
MGIVVNLDVMMAKRKIGLGELAQKVDLTPANLSILKTGKAKAIRFSTLEAICNALECQPGDILEFENSIDSDIENNINQANNYSPKTNKNEK